MKNKLFLFAMILSILAGPALAGYPTPSGINPATGVEWANGDMYRLVFHTSATHNAVSTDIAVYNAWVQGLADASTAYDIGADDGVTWKVIGSTADVDARDNTSTNPTDPTDPNCPILLLDGTTIVAVDNPDLWDGVIQNIINLTEQGTEWAHWPFTGTYLDGTESTGKPQSYAPLGGTGNVQQGKASEVDQWIHPKPGGWIGDPPETLRPFYAMSNPLVVGGGGPTYISPENGSTVPVGDVDLLWENLNPINPVDPVYVDVWFGTDPISDFTQVVTADPNRITYKATALTKGTYYWQVANYIKGPGHINEPNRLDGPVWSFHVNDDVPPSSVDILTPDTITWSGQAVSLDAEVDDDDKSPLHYLWTADPEAGVVFDPDEFVKNPEVTITKDTANPSTVTLTISVHDEILDPTPVTDEMTIDVYDDACKAAIGAGLATIDPTDFDANCITDLRDYAVFAAKWLVDNALTAPVSKP